jgi:subtilisin family serine protease
MVKKWKSSVVLLLCSLVINACNKTDDTVSSLSACLSSAELKSALNRAMNMEQTNDDAAMIVRVEDPARDLDGLRQELALAHGPAAEKLGKIRLRQISEKFISLQLPKSSPAVAVLQKKIDEGKILYVEPDYKTFRSDGIAGYNDPELSGQWAYSKINAFAAWEKTQGGKVVVAVIDSGVDYNHRDLAPNMWHNPREVGGNGIDDDGNGYVDDVYGWDFSQGNSDPMADDSPKFHGTHVAGTVAAALNNGVGGSGVAPNVQIMALKYLDSSGSGRTSNAILAIDYAVRNGARILSNSWGSFNYSASLRDAIENARKHNVIFVAAAGNGDSNGNGVNIDVNPFYPAAYAIDNIISVAASNQSDALTTWSNYGRTRVSVAAPGQCILSTRNGNTYATMSGTSMAAPAVSGVMGLIVAANPNLNYRQAKDILMSTVDKVGSLSNKVAAGGRVNALSAVNAALAATGQPIPSVPNGPPEATPIGCFVQ